MSAQAQGRRGPLLTLLLVVAFLLAAPLGARAQDSTDANGASTEPVITAADTNDGVLLEAADRVELASVLAEATDENDVCFGYYATLDTPDGSYEDSVSNAGPDVRAEDAICPNGAIELQVDLTYTCNSCESEDSASWEVTSTVPGLTTDVIEHRLDLIAPLAKAPPLNLVGRPSGGGLLLTDDGDRALRDATAALPLTLDAPVAANLPAKQAAASGDHLTGDPGTDWLRGKVAKLVAALLALLIALGTISFLWPVRPQWPSRR